MLISESSVIQNILVFSENPPLIKLADFGLAREIRGDTALQVSFVARSSGSYLMHHRLSVVLRFSLPRKSCFAATLGASIMTGKRTRSLLGLRCSICKRSFKDSLIPESQQMCRIAAKYPWNSADLVVDPVGIGFDARKIAWCDGFSDHGSFFICRFEHRTLMSGQPRT